MSTNNSNLHMIAHEHHYLIERFWLSKLLNL